MRYLTHGKTFDITERKAPPTAAVDELEIEAVGPLVLLERELPGPAPWFSVASLGLWVVIRDAR